ncbi:MAG: hypothetical protein ABFS39_06485 [Pseudomonadota bacterium]
MKPDTSTAMRNLIAQVRETLPFELTSEQICADSCDGCSMKLLAYLESELDGWEQRLQDGERPNFGDLTKLARTSKKVYQVLKNNGLSS